VPLYEYACASCGRRYEKREGFDAPARQKCQHCGKSAQRVLHAPPIVFKGSGFYKTDSRGTSSATADSAPVTAPASPSSNGHSHPHTADAGHAETPNASSTESPAVS
jgi:putative FmdB family regulatory protein